MASNEYGLLDEGMRRNTVYNADRQYEGIRSTTAYGAGRQHNDNNIYRQKQNGETSRFPSGQSEAMHPRHGYEPPIQSEYINNAMHHEPLSNEPKGEEKPLLDDHEFITLATSILSSMEQNQVMKLNEREKSISATIILQKILPLGKLKQFSDTIDVRFRSLSKYPSWGESQHCTIVRRCEEMFGNELRVISHMRVEFFPGSNKENDDVRDDHFDSSTFPDKKAEARRGVNPEDAYPLNEHNSKNSTVKSSQNARNLTKDSDNKEDGTKFVDIDMTQHIVWGNLQGGKDASGPSKEPAERACETASNVSSHFNDSEVYEMVVDAPKDTPDCSFINLEDSRVNLEDSGVNLDSKQDVDEKSVASLYSLSRDKSILSPEVKHRKIVSVQAPEALPGNFMFEARMNDEVFMVNVPKGGVKKGEVFKSVALNIDSTSAFDPTGRMKRMTEMHAPAFQWRDNLLNIFANGICHPMALNSFFCTHVSLAQVMTRMHLDSAGNKTASLRSRVHFNIVLVVPLVLAMLHGVLFFLMFRAFHLHLKGQLWIFIYSSIPVVIVDISLFGYFIYMTAKVRRIVRQEYNIQEDSCMGYRDEVLSLFCSPFVVAQMGRHTADYETYVGMFCTKTGFSDHIEVKLPSDDKTYNAVGIAV